MNDCIFNKLKKVHKLVEEPKLVRSEEFIIESVITTLDKKQTKDEKEIEEKPKDKEDY